MIELNQLYLAWLRIVKDIDTDMPLHIIGGPTVTGKEEWIQPKLLSQVPMPSRVTDLCQWIAFEIMCYSMHGNYRKDGNINRPYELADKYARVFAGKRFNVGDVSVQCNEGKKIHLDLQNLGDFAQGISQSSPYANIHCVQLSFEGKIYQVNPLEE